MEIENEKGIFDIDKNSTISIERTNPLLNEQGSMSLPYSMKRTDRNDYLLGDPQNYERKDTFNVKQAMNIRAGLLNENATFEMLSIDSEKVEGVFYLYESSFYNQIKEVKLPAVFEGVERWFKPKKEEFTEEERLEYVAHILEIFEGMIRTYPDYSDDFTVFPAASDCELSSRTLFGRIQGSATSQNIINEVYMHFETEQVGEVRMKAKEPYEYTDDEGNTIKIPIGYGVSPFLRFGYILKKIFEYFDLTLEPTIFETESVFRRIVAVNNTQDAIMPGYLIESQLVPDCTINDFLDIIREGMCGDFIIDVPNKTARLVFFKDVVNSQPDKDLSQYITSKFEKIEFNQPKKVYLTTEKSLPKAESATDTLDEFISKYPKFNPIPPWLGIGIENEGIYPFYSTNSIWKVSEPLSEWLTTTYKMDYLSSLNFDYNNNADMDREEHKAPFELPVTIPLKSADEVFSFYTMIIGKLRNLNSLVILESDKQAEESSECPIILAVESYNIARCGVVSDDNIDGVTPPESGNPLEYPFVSLYTWSKTGLYKRFWKEYDRMLQTSFHQITYNAELPANLLQNFSFDKLKLINGQPLIPMSLKYEMTDQPLVKVEMLFKTVKLYGEETSGGDEPGSHPELDSLVGAWVVIQGEGTTPGFNCNFELYEDYTGKIYMKDEEKTIDTEFDSISYTVTVLGLSLLLHAPEGYIEIAIWKRPTIDNIVTILWTNSLNIGVMVKI